VFKLFKVSGSSMKPTLKHNDLLLAYKTKDINVNDIIVAKPDNKTLIVKRVKNINSGKIEFSSDNKNIESDFSDVSLINNFYIVKAFLVYRLPIKLFFL
tara:strand:- start:152 stop:448 length:297 start_codon:yes stop_codon:yes gene_type:complete